MDKYIIKQNSKGQYQVIKEGNKRATAVFENERDARDYALERGTISNENELNRKRSGRLVLRFFIGILGLAIGVIVGFIGGNTFLNIKEDDDHNDNNPGVVSTDIFSIHFLELGNKYTGDSIYIKAGENDILIDAGSRGNSAQAICEYVDDYCEDNTLEYVIATHAHQDHIAGFVGTSSIPGIFDYYKCETIIDFPLTKATSQVYKNYVLKRDAEVKNDGATHYTALECYNNENGAKRTYEIADGIKMTILYNYYYEHETSDENDYSVCLLFNDGSNNYLFTGDLEHDGEAKLVQYNNLPKCKVFKAGHHGSPTSSREELLEVIEPEIVCVCCCTGSDEYTNNNANMFPSQAFINRVAKYTDLIYATSIVSGNKEGFESLNGNIVVSLREGVIVVNCSNNNVILKETEWFKEYRTWPSDGK